MNGKTALWPPSRNEPTGMASPTSRQGHRSSMSEERTNTVSSLFDDGVAIVYLSPRLLCRFDLTVRAISIRRRIASGRPGLSG